MAEGVRNLREGDWVIPAQAHMGTWQSLAIWKEADVLKFPKDIMPLEYGAVCREMCLAYRLLEDANLKVCHTEMLSPVPEIEFKMSLRCP